MSGGRTAVIAAAAVGLFVFSWGGWATYDYVQHDPGFCTNCHIMEDAYVKWEQSAHSQVTCHACHAPDLAANLRQLYVYWTDPPVKPEHAPELENSACYGCHRVDDEGIVHEAGGPHHEWENVLEEAGHQKHVKKERIQCIRCHSTSLHKFVPPSEICKSCHKHQDLEKTAMDEHCTACHNFTAVARENLLPARGDCLECHAEMQVAAEIFVETNGKGEKIMHWECGKCHKPHEKVKLSHEDCVECHDKDIGESELHAVDDHSDCLSCHRPHLWKVASAETCQECHDDKGEEHTEGEFCGECHE